MCRLLNPSPQHDAGAVFTGVKILPALCEYTRHFMACDVSGIVIYSTFHIEG